MDVKYPVMLLSRKLTEVRNHNDNKSTKETVHNEKELRNVLSSVQPIPNGTYFGP